MKLTIPPENLKTIDEAAASELRSALKWLQEAWWKRLGKGSAATVIGINVHLGVCILDAIAMQREKEKVAEDTLSQEQL